MFVTPHVVGGTDGTSPETLDKIEQSKTRPRTVQEGLNKNDPKCRVENRWRRSGYRNPSMSILL
jgi:hypothetical protein